MRTFPDLTFSCFAFPFSFLVLPFLPSVFFPSHSLSFLSLLFFPFFIFFFLSIMTYINTTSNASNYPDFIHSGVDPWTGSFSTSVSLGRFLSHSGTGPTFALLLNFTPGSDKDFGFGRGWTLPTGFYDSSVQAYPRSVSYTHLTLPTKVTV